MTAVRVRMNMLSDTEKYNTFFTFEYKGEMFVVWQDITNAENDFSWCPLKWNAWSGAYRTYDDCTRDVDTIVNIIINQSRKGNKKFKLTGEHYTARKCNSGYMISGSKKCSYFDLPHKVIPLVSRVIVGLVFAILYALLYINTSGIMWARSVFPSLNRSTLVNVMWCTEIMGALAFIVFNRFRRDISDLYLDSLIPLNVFTLIGALKSNQTIKWIILILAAILVVVFVAPKIFACIHEKKPKLKKKKMVRAIKSAAIPSYICIFACMLIVGWFGVSGITYRANYSFNGDEEKAYERYREACDLISEEKWVMLGKQERINVLQWISDYECVFALGCKTADVQTGYPKSECVLGEYNHIQNTITINEEHLMASPVEEVIDTLLHETRHVWQQTISDMYNEIEDKLSDEYKKLSFFQTAEEIRDNFDSYTSGTRDFDEYYFQIVESDSRDWAEFELMRYENYIHPKIREAEE